MSTDFEDMKRTREEAKKQLEAKFQDVYRLLQHKKMNKIIFMQKDLKYKGICNIRRKKNK